jgi:tetratricopeptide (TPR) repeat protein
MKLHQLTTGLLGAALLASSALADSYLLRNGTELRGTVSSTDEERMTIRLDAPAGAIATFMRDQVEPHSWYVARSQTIGDDAKARLDLARYCIANGLFFVAERELDRVVEAAPGLATAADAERARAHDGGGKKLVELARDAIAKNDLARAANFVGTILRRYDDTAAAGEAPSIVDDIAQRRGELEQQRVAEMQRRAVEKKTAAQVAILKDLSERVGAARRQNVIGLKSKDLSSAQEAFTSALRRFAAVTTEIDAQASRNQDDQELLPRLAELRSTCLTESIEVHVNMGSTYVVRGSYTKAAEHANDALALDPKSAYARDFRARVELAAAEAASGRGRVRHLR